jgi:type VI protein secretion system component VasF
MENSSEGAEAVEAAQPRRKGYRKRRAFWKRRGFWIGMISIAVAIMLVLWLISSLGRHHGEVD